MEPVERLADKAEELAAKYSSEIPAENIEESIAEDEIIREFDEKSVVASDIRSELAEKTDSIIDTEKLEQIFGAEESEELTASIDSEILTVADQAEKLAAVMKSEAMNDAENFEELSVPDFLANHSEGAEELRVDDAALEPLESAEEPNIDEIIPESAENTVSGLAAMDLSHNTEGPVTSDSNEDLAEIAEGSAAADGASPEDSESVEGSASADNTSPEDSESVEEPAAADNTSPETSEKAQTATVAGRAEKNAKKKKKMHPLLKVLIALLIIVVLAAVAVGVATYTKYITWFEDGPMISNKEDLTMQLDAENLEKLNNFKNLKHVDLTGSPAGFEAVKAWADAHPNVDVDYMVDIPENATFDISTGLVDFTKLDAASAIANIEGVQELLKGKSVKIDPDTWTADDIETFCKKLTRFELVNAKKTFKNDSIDTIQRFMAAVPDFEFDGTVALGSTEASITETTMDFSEMSDEDLKVLDEFLNVLPVYTDIDLGSEFAHDRLATIGEFYKKHPDIEVHYEFGVLGQRHDINDTILDFNHIYMNDQGAEVRSVIEWMPKLKILDMDWCLVDNAHMEAIRNDFPNVDVEWRLWFAGNDFYSVRTDAEKIFLSQFGNGMLDNADCAQLKYCTKVKYMDIGHNEELSDASFLAYMPELEVLVLSINLIDDISGLANCKHLEYFEMFNTHITNLDALEGLTELRHLNVCQNPYLTDITGTYGLSGLERFWIGDAWSTSVPREQVEKFKELNPDTLTVDYTYGAHTAGWREGERYALLWQQMGYDEEESDYSFYWKDPENPAHPYWTKYSEENGYTAENGYWNKYPVLQTGMWF